MPRQIPFSEAAARAAIAASTSWADALRCLGYQPKGSNYRTIRRWARNWGIAVDHFDPNAGRRKASAARAVPLDTVLTENSPYPRWCVKKRLLAAGLKRLVCEICGQGPLWHGKQLSLVLDHVNGVSNDHRLENLRMLCPNCAATLDTHCGRNLPRERVCPSCNQMFAPRHIRHRYCSQSCWGAMAARLYRGRTHPQTRKVDRPSYAQLKEDIASMSFLAVGRKYGVSDNAVRKWLRWYEYQTENGAAGGEGEAVPGERNEEADREAA